MKKFDVFNGDADGLCALHQMRLAEPADSVLITGVKRDIQLLNKIEAEQDAEILVLDISLAKNSEAAYKLLNNACRILYFDHHLPGEIPNHPAFESHINTAADTCTSLLVNHYLGGQYVLWAIVGAYGDNMLRAADLLGDNHNLSDIEKVQLQELGICLNYNGYGATLDDLHFEPVALYQAMKAYLNPFDFIGQEPVFKTLKAGYDADMAQAASLRPDVLTDQMAVYVLPPEKWCRRVAGVLGNDLANQYPQRAHALLTSLAEGGYQVSVRAPQINKTGAGDLCSQFESGGGRAGAAGINYLPEADYDRFVAAFQQQYQ